MRHRRKTFHVPKGFKIALIGLSLSIGILIAGAWYWNTHKQGIIRDKIEDAIEEGSQGLYKAQYDSLQVDETSGYLAIYNLRLTYDSNRYISASQKQSAPPVLMNISIPEIRVSGIQTPRALLEREIKGKRIDIRNPVIDMYYTYQGKDSARNVPTSEVYEQILGKLKWIEIDTIAITGAQLRTKNLKTGRLIVEVKDISLVLGDVKIDSLAQQDSTRIFFARQLELTADEVGWLADNNLYRHQIKNIQLHSDSGELNVGEFHITPRLAEDAFANAVRTQDDRFDFSFYNIRLTNVDVQRLLNEELRANTLFISSPRLKIYRDLARPRDGKNRVGSYPHQVINSLPWNFKVNKVIVANGFVEYKERNHITRKSGKVRFHNISAVINNFTNDKASIAQNNLMTADVRTSFLNKTVLNTNWTFYLRHPNGRFGVRGQMGGIDALQLNELAEPMGPARIEKGKMKSLQFDLNGNNHNTKARVKVLYSDLKLSLLERDKGAAETDKKFLASLLANIVIKNDNPKNDDEPREVELDYTRDPNRSIFNLCWKAIFKGIKETLGVKK